MLLSRLFSENKKVDPGITWDVGEGGSGSQICPTMYSLLVFSLFLTKPLSGSGCIPPASEPAGAGLPAPLPGARYIPLVTDMLHLLFLKDVQLPLCLSTNKSRKQRQHTNHIGMIANIPERRFRVQEKNQQCWLAKNPQAPTLSRRCISELPEVRRLDRAGKLAGWRASSKSSPNKTSRKVLSHLWTDFSCLWEDEVCLLISLHYEYFPYCSKEALMS